MRISVSELKNNLARYLRLASKGTPVVITRHRKPLARLRLIAQSGDTGLENVMQVEGTGWNGRKPVFRPGVRPRQAKGRSAADYMLDERG